MRETCVLIAHTYFISQHYSLQYQLEIGQVLLAPNIYEALEQGAKLTEAKRNLGCLTFPNDNQCAKLVLKVLYAVLQIVLNP